MKSTVFGGPCLTRCGDPLERGWHRSNAKTWQLQKNSDLNSTGIISAQSWAIFGYCIQVFFGRFTLFHWRKKHIHKRAKSGIWGAFAYLCAVLLPDVQDVNHAESLVALATKKNKWFQTRKKKSYRGSLTSSTHVNYSMHGTEDVRKGRQSCPLGDYGCDQQDATPRSERFPPEKGEQRISRYDWRSLCGDFIPNSHLTPPAQFLGTTLQYRPVIKINTPTRNPCSHFWKNWKFQQELELNFCQVMENRHIRNGVK